MKISDINIDTVKEYLRIDNDYENTLLNNLLNAGKSFVISYTGLDSTKLDDKEDVALAILVLINEMYSNREYTVDKDTLNPVVSSILNMYCVNLL